MLKYLDRLTCLMHKRVKLRMYCSHLYLKSDTMKKSLIIILLAVFAITTVADGKYNGETFNKYIF